MTMHNDGPAGPAGHHNPLTCPECSAALATPKPDNDTVPVNRFELHTRGANTILALVGSMVRARAGGAPAAMVSFNAGDLYTLLAFAMDIRDLVDEVMASELEEVDAEADASPQASAQVLDFLAAQAGKRPH